MTLLLSFTGCSTCICVENTERDESESSKHSTIFFYAAFSKRLLFFRSLFYGMLLDFLFFAFFPRKNDRRFFPYRITNDDRIFWTWQIEKNNNILFDLKCWLNCPHCRESPGTDRYVCVCVSVCSRTLSFCQEFGKVEPFSTQIKRGCQKMAKHIKWNNTWKFNSTKTFDRSKQRNCTWIEQKCCFRFFWLFNA